jgi:quinol monooxygenase YgiN
LPKYEPEVLGVIVAVASHNVECHATENVVHGIILLFAPHGPNGQIREIFWVARETERKFIMSQETVGLVVNGTIEIAPEDREQFVALVQENVAQTQGIPGCIFYTFTADVRNPNLFHNVEAWTNRAALDTHMHSKLMQAAFAEVGKLRVLSRDVTAYTVNGSSKL